MSTFLDNIRKWHGEMPFPPFKILAIKNDLRRAIKTIPWIKNFTNLLDAVHQCKLPEPQFPAYWPNNMAEILEALGIKDSQTFESVFKSSKLSKAYMYLTPPVYDVDRIHLLLISASEIITLIKDQCLTISGFDSKMGDARWWLCPDSVVEEVVKCNSINKEPYLTTKIDGQVKYIHDCENFGLELAARFAKPDLGGLAFGQIWVQTREVKTNNVVFGHGIDLYINEKKVVKFVEPQTDQIFMPKDTHLIAGKELQFWIEFIMMV